MLIIIMIIIIIIIIIVNLYSAKSIIKCSKALCKSYSVQ
jgi:hypothetical protein